MPPMRFSGYHRDHFPRRNSMSDALSFVEINAQQVELLPARTVLSLFSTGGGGGRGGNGGGCGDGGGGPGGLRLDILYNNLFCGPGHSPGKGVGGAGGGAARGGGG